MKNAVLLSLIASLTLGLAPFKEPHIWKQINNLAKGRPMEMIDWVDLLMHGTPWVALVITTFLWIRKNKKSPSQM